MMPRFPRATLIDVHHHLLPPRYLAEKRSEVERISPGFARVLEWTPEQSLVELDAAGNAAAILSLSVPGVWFGDAAETLRLARLSNDYGAELKQRHPDRFGYFATLPLPDTQSAIAEAQRALDEGDADGIGLFTNYGDRHLGDPAFAALLDALNARGAIVYVHPATHSCCVNMVAGLSPPIIEFPFDTTRTIASLLLSGTLTRCPSIRFVFSHGGGALPMLAGRIATWASIRGMPMDHALGLLRGLWFDTASVTNVPGYAALRCFAPLDRVLYGSDYPYGLVAQQCEELAAIEADATALKMISVENARTLFIDVNDT